MMYLKKSIERCVTRTIIPFGFATFLPSMRQTLLSSNTRKPTSK